LNPFQAPCRVAPFDRTDGMPKRAGRRLGTKTTRQLTALIERDGDLYVALCPGLDIASQGKTVEEARGNLVEALELFFETADPSEVKSRLPDEFFVTRVEVGVG
jgi:predicted RNase H-like HicB family nuclease